MAAEYIRCLWPWFVTGADRLFFLCYEIGLFPFTWYVFREDFQHSDTIAISRPSRGLIKLQDDDSGSDCSWCNMVILSNKTIIYILNKREMCFCSSLYLRGWFPIRSLHRSSRSLRRFEPGPWTRKWSLASARPLSSCWSESSKPCSSAPADSEAEKRQRRGDN